MKTEYLQRQQNGRNIRPYVQKNNFVIEKSVTDAEMSEIIQSPSDQTTKTTQYFLEGQ